jgi:MATE family multidrug resistance protein
VLYRIAGDNQNNVGNYRSAGNKTLGISLEAVLKGTPINYIKKRWQAEGGYREFLVLALPLILTTASWSVQYFVDRMFLTWYSTEALAAALPAGITNFIFVGFFIGIAQYINTFVAQYYGAGQFQQVGPAVWQGAYLALVAAVCGLGLTFLAKPLFTLVGHDAAIQAQEVVYFRTLCYGMGPIALSTAGSCFFTGRGRTWTVLVVNVAVTGINIVLDYSLIFGKLGLPAAGIQGAAWATNTSAMCGALAFFVLLTRVRYRARYNTLKGWRLAPELFRRLLRFGGPNGLNFMLDIFAFSFFVLIVGRLGTVELAATNLAFNINSLAFMPLIGCGIAVSTLVGQRLGANRPDNAEYCTWTGMHLALVYMGVMSAAYLLLPNLFLAPFDTDSQGPEFADARAMAVILLRLVALYCLFDALYIIFTAALKGAGDTRYVMVVSMLLGWGTLLLPCVVALVYFDAGVYTLWAFMCGYLILLGIVFYRRFRAGRWKSMRVIETSTLGSVEAGVGHSTLSASE